MTVIGVLEVSDSLIAVGSFAFDLLACGVAFGGGDRHFLAELGEVFAGLVKLCAQLLQLVSYLRGGLLGCGGSGGLVAGVLAGGFGALVGLDAGSLG